MGFSIRTARLHEYDPRFEASPLGEAHGAEVRIVPAVGKVVGATGGKDLPLGPPTHRPMAPRIPPETNVVTPARMRGSASLPGDAR